MEEQKFVDDRCYCPAEGLLGKYNNKFYELRGKIGQLYSAVKGERVDVFVNIRVYKNYFTIRCPRCGRWHKRKITELSARLDNIV